MTDKKVGPSDFAAEVERLKAEGKLPLLDEVLDAVAEARTNYAPKILKVREKTLASVSSAQRPQCH